MYDQCVTCILYIGGDVCHSDLITSLYVCAVVKRDIQESDEEAVRVKEQSILELGGLLAKTGQAAGNRT